jgi:hypothetical protein
VLRAAPLRVSFSARGCSTSPRPLPQDNSKKHRVLAWPVTASHVFAWLVTMITSGLNRYVSEPTMQRQDIPL